MTITVRVSPSWTADVSRTAAVQRSSSSWTPTLHASRSQFIDDEYVTLTVVDAPSELGEFAIIEVLSTGSASDHEAAVLAAEPVIESMTFSP